MIVPLKEDLRAVEELILKNLMLLKASLNAYLKTFMLVQNLSLANTTCVTRVMPVWFPELRLLLHTIQHFKYSDPSNDVKDFQKRINHLVYEVRNTNSFLSQKLILFEGMSCNASLETFPSCLQPDEQKTWSRLDIIPIGSDDRILNLDNVLYNEHSPLWSGCVTEIKEKFYGILTQQCCSLLKKNDQRSLDYCPVKASSNDLQLISYQGIIKPLTNEAKFIETCDDIGRLDPMPLVPSDFYLTDCSLSIQLDENAATPEYGIMGRGVLWNLFHKFSKNYIPRWSELSNFQQQLVVICVTALCFVLILLLFIVLLICFVKRNRNSDNPDPISVTMQNLLCRCCCKKPGSQLVTNLSNHFRSNRNRTSLNVGDVIAHERQLERALSISPSRRSEIQPLRR